MESYSKARLEILNHIVTFYTIDKRPGSNHVNSIDGSGFVITDMFENDHPPIGSLCKLISAPFTKWYLSWLIEVDEQENHYNTRYLLKSIEDGSLSWWTNVRLYYFKRDAESLHHPHWEWSDNQFLLKERWFRVFKKRGAYMTCAKMPEFTKDGGVILSTRMRFGLNDHSGEKKFDNWKKVKFSDMLAFYDEVVAATENKN